MEHWLQTPILYSDAEALSTFASSTWSSWGPARVVTHDDIHEFGLLTQNRQWIHEDAWRAERESPYGGLIAHGLLLVSLIPSLLPEESFVVVGHSVRIVRGIDQLRLLSPVFPSDTVHARVRLRDARPAPSGKGTILTRDVEVWSTTGAKPAVTCSLSLQYF